MSIMDRPVVVGRWGQSRLFLGACRCLVKNEGNRQVSQKRIATGKIELDNSTAKNSLLDFLRKEVIQPHLPIRLPCYDFTPVIEPAFDSSFLSVRSLASGIPNLFA